MEKTAVIKGQTKDIHYKLVGDMYFHEDTPTEVCDIILAARKSNAKLKFHWGDSATGRDWNEENDVIGYIGKSTGRIPVPLLLESRNSSGGGALLDHCVVKIVNNSTGKILYQHPLYKAPQVEITPSDMEGYTHNTVVNGEIYGRHTSRLDAEKLKAHLLK